MTIKRNNELSKKLLEEGEKRDREEFGELVKKGGRELKCERLIIVV